MATKANTKATTTTAPISLAKAPAPATATGPVCAATGVQQALMQAAAGGCGQAKAGKQPASPILHQALIVGGGATPKGHTVMGMVYRVALAHPGQPVGAYLPALHKAFAAHYAKVGAAPAHWRQTQLGCVLGYVSGAVRDSHLATAMPSTAPAS